MSYTYFKNFLEEKHSHTEKGLRHPSLDATSITALL